MTDLGAFVNAAGLNTEEVLMVLVDYFGSARMEPGRVTFERQGALVDVEISRHGRIIRVRTGPGVTAVVIDAIQRKLEDALITGQNAAVGQHVGFCSRPVESFYRYRDKFQIVPMPGEAPRPEVLAADHPFLLQCIYTWSPHMQVRYRRRLQQAHGYFRLLDLLSGTRIRVESSYARHTWVMPPVEEFKDDPSRWASKWLQLGYTYPGLAFEVQGFSEASDYPRMEFAPAGHHFAHPGITGDSLALPDDIEPALDLAFGLRDDDRERLDRALIYLHQAKSVWPEARSLSYIAHAMAIEALMDRPEQCAVCNQALLEEGGRCDACGQAMFGTTRAFREFLETHAPIIRDEPQIRNRLYGLRNDLAHGNDVMLVDMFPYSGPGEYAREESRLEETLHRIVGTAIRSWLHSRARVET